MKGLVVAIYALVLLTGLGLIAGGFAIRMALCFVQQPVNPERTKRVTGIAVLVGIGILVIWGTALWIFPVLD